MILKMFEPLRFDCTCICNTRGTANKLSFSFFSQKEGLEILRKQFTRNVNLHFRKKKQQQKKKKKKKNNKKQQLENGYLNLTG